MVGYPDWIMDTKKLDSYYEGVSVLRSIRPEVFCEKVFLKISQNLHDARLQACNFITRETLAHVFSCEFCEIFKSILFYRTPLVGASVF